MAKHGRQILMESLLAHGIDHIFGNPGTTESPLLDALPNYPAMRYVTVLQESVAMGAASFHAQATGKPTAVNLHVAPGLGNALGMIYGALKANSPVLVTAGQQDTRMLLREPVLSHDLAAIAAPVTKWSAQVERTDDLAPMVRRALKIACDPPMGPVFLALPINVLAGETEVGTSVAGPLRRVSAPSPEGIEESARALLAARQPAIVVGDDVARAGAVEAARRVAEAVGAGVWHEGLRHHAAFPTDHPNARGPLGFDAAGVRKALAECDVVLLLGGPFLEEVWYAPGSSFPEGARLIQMETSPARLAYNFPLAAGMVGDLALGLAALAEALELGADDGQRAVAATRNEALAARTMEEKAGYEGRLKRAWDRSPISMARAMAELARGAPEDIVVVDESITANLDLAQAFTFRGFGDYFSGRGGGIGQGLAGALGVKLAMPDRPVLTISGDGSAMYSIQALWTAAHLELDIVFVILANGEYRVLKHNLDTYRQRFDALSNQGYPHMNLTLPELGFPEMAAGMGVAGQRIADPNEIADAVREAFRAGGPRLIEVAIEGKR